MGHRRPAVLFGRDAIDLVCGDMLFVPIGVFTEHIYPWANAEIRGTLPPGKAVYLETVFFCQRAAGYFIVWLVLSWLLGKVSRLELPPASTPAMRRMGAITLVLLVPTATFAAFDWGMSLEPEWYSSIYGALLSAGGVLAAHALAIIGVTTIGAGSVGTILRHAAPGQASQSNEATAGEHATNIYNELGNLLLAFLMVNTYFAFSQFLIIWTGNLPSEITWYLRRMNSGWASLALVIVVFHFVVPFLMLLSRDVKRDPRQLRFVALMLLSMYAAHLYWMIVPAFSYQGSTGYMLNVAAFAALLRRMAGGFRVACEPLPCPVRLARTLRTPSYRNGSCDHNFKRHQSATSRLKPTCARFGSPASFSLALSSGHS